MLVALLETSVPDIPPSSTPPPPISLQLCPPLPPPFSGPYIKWFLDKCGHDGLNRMLVGFEDKSAYAQCIFAYTPAPDVEPITFIGQTAGRIVPARGPTDFGWDPVFEPEGFNQTYAELDKTIKNTISHRYRALDKLRQYLLIQQHKPTPSNPS
eukprot:jgi/Chrzof1/4148/Cz14g00260.t1